MNADYFPLQFNHVPFIYGSITIIYNQEKISAKMQHIGYILYVVSTYTIHSFDALKGVLQQDAGDQLQAIPSIDYHLSLFPLRSHILACIFSCYNTGRRSARLLRAHPRRIWDLPPGGARTRLEGLPVMTLNELVAAALAKALLDTGPEGLFAAGGAPKTPFPCMCFCLMRSAAFLGDSSASADLFVACEVDGKMPFPAICRCLVRSAAAAGESSPPVSTATDFGETSSFFLALFVVAVAGAPPKRKPMLDFPPGGPSTRDVDRFTNAFWLSFMLLNTSGFLINQQHQQRSWFLGFVVAVVVWVKTGSQSFTWILNLLRR